MVNSELMDKIFLDVERRTLRMNLKKLQKSKPRKLIKNFNRDWLFEKQSGIFFLINDSPVKQLSFEMMNKIEDHPAYLKTTRRVISYPL